MSVVEALKEFGGADPIHHAFNQGAYRGANDRIDGVSIANGYCAGVVLDWARRVLLSRADRDEAYLNFTNNPSHTDTLKRMVLGYTGQAANYVGTTNREQVLALLIRLQNGVEVEDSDYGLGVHVSNAEARLLETMWQIPGAPNSSFARFNFQYTHAGSLDKAAIARLIANLQGRADPQHRARDAKGRQWENLAAELDARHIAQRRRLGKDAKKLFSNIKVERTATLKKYDQPGEWMHVVMNQSLTPRACTVYTFQPDGGGTGHAIAVWQKDNTTYLFFDPNYGVFSYTKDNLKRCFQHLFWSVLGHADRQELDGTLPVYQRRDRPADPASPAWNTMGYTVFVAR